MFDSLQMINHEGMAIALYYNKQARCSDLPGTIDSQKMHLQAFYVILCRSMAHVCNCLYLF